MQHGPRLLLLLLLLLLTLPLLIDETARALQGHLKHDQACERVVKDNMDEKEQVAMADRPGGYTALVSLLCRSASG